MNTKNLKAYAPKARTQFIEAVKKRAAHFGIYEDRIEDVRIEGGAAIIEGRAFTRKEGEQRKRLESKLAERGYDMFTREIAYTWFNRLAALRYMEIHDYFDHGFRVLSHPTNQGSLPEILNHASDVAESLNLAKDHIIELQLAGDKEEELYRELLLGQCHQLAKIMPQIFKGLAFEAIDDATELLLPNNLTKTDSILKGLINDIPEEDWQEIEVIGWLYQFYISEHKDAVIGKVVKSEDIPAATQLFTPSWIVKYLVQNSLGRQWLATYPDSELKGKMDYYIEPAEQSDEVIEQLKAITPTSIDPEEIKVLDPACGSGHILVEVYEVLREIYLERGYRLREIPELILTKNIYGLDIDDRASQLAGFALMMKAREDDRRIFQRVEDGEVSLNVFSLQSTEHLDIPKLWKALDLEGNQRTGSTGGLFEDTKEFVQPTGIYKEYYELLQFLRSSFLEAKTLGSLIQIEDAYLDTVILLKEELNKKLRCSDPAAKQSANELLPLINQLLLLAQQYDVVVANPPYMGSKYQNKTVKDYLKLNYKGFEKDLFSSFIVKCGELTKDRGKLGFMSPNVWMYISTHQKLRHWLLDNNYLSSLIELPLGAFKGATVQICAFTLEKVQMSNMNGSYIRLVGNKGGDEEMSLLTKSIIQTKEEESYFEKSSNSFQFIPGSPIAYYLDEQLVNTFSKHKNLGSISHSFQGIITGDNEYYLRGWQEIDSTDMKLDTDPHDEFNREYWLPYAKGGAYRKWFGNGEYLIRWDGSGNDMTRSRGENKNYYYLEGAAWSDVTSGKSSFRYTPSGGLFDAAGPIAFLTNTDVNIYGLIGYLNSQYVADISKVLNPTIHFQSENYKSLPYIYEIIQDKAFINNSHQCIDISKNDWDQFELSWHFKANPLININFDNIKQCFNEYDEDCVSVTQRMLKLELDNERIFRSKLGFSQTNIKPVKLEDICLLANPAYRYGSKSSKEEQKQKFQSDTFIELLSYSIGCAMGRYSLDQEGVVYAQSNNTGFKELEAEGAYKKYPADDDGIIPLASEEWLFADDATTRFKEFVKTVWGEQNLTENLEFVAESLCLHALKPLSTKKGSSESAMHTVRRYFSTQFFKDHCKTYKKRPIYWLFSSGKEKAFECLVYLHRYNEGTLSRMRTEYVTPLMGKYEAQHTLLSEQQLQATGTESRGIEKDLKSLEKKQAELRTFDEQLKHYAEKRITLDLDDGVKANYGKFGNLLADVKAIHGNAVK